MDAAESCKVAQLGQRTKCVQVGRAVSLPRYEKKFLLVGVYVFRYEIGNHPKNKKKCWWFVFFFCLHLFFFRNFLGPVKSFFFLFLFLWILMWSKNKFGCFFLALVLVAYFYGPTLFGHRSMMGNEAALEFAKNQGVQIEVKWLSPSFSIRKTFKQYYFLQPLKKMMSSCCGSFNFHQATKITYFFFHLKKFSFLNAWTKKKHGNGRKKWACCGGGGAEEEKQH